MQQDANTLVDILTGQRPGDTHKREMVAAICNNIRDHALSSCQRCWKSGTGTR